MDAILYGAGSDIEKIIPLLKSVGYNAICIADSNEKKIGKVIKGIPIVAAESISKYDTKTIIITASFFDSIYDIIANIIGEDIDKYSVLVAPYAWLMLVNVEYDRKLLDESSKYMSKYQKEIREIYDCNDSKTKRFLDFIIEARLKKDYTFYPYEDVKGFQYVEGYFYENELNNYNNITFLDVGAYVGDTYESMLNMYDNISNYYAYEPSFDNYRILKKTIIDSHSEIKTTCKNVALGDVNGTIKMGKSGGEFGVTDNHEGVACEEVEVIRLDDEEIYVDGRLVIKMDVEGAEMSVLRGGIQTIIDNKPIMAICVYHRYQDLFEIPNYLMENGLQYRYVLKSGIHTHLLAIPSSE